MEEKTPLSKTTRWGIALVVIIILIGGGYFYYEHEEKYPSTDDAYVHGNIIFVAAQVGGRLKEVEARNYQFVHKGEILFQIDPAPYQAQVQRSKAALQLTSQENEADSSGILAASEELIAATASLKDTQLTYKRTMELVADGDLPAQSADNERAALANAEANVSAAKDHMAQLVAEQGAKGAQAPAVQEAAAALLQATLNLSYTNIPAPKDGQLGVVSVHIGSVINQSQALTPLVQADSFWVAANYKESDLQRIRLGMPASITLDMYPDQPFKGHVSDISPASGSSFSLLPPENASGNWVKVTQRFPVSIQFDPGSDTSNHPLRVGASSTVTINTVASQ
ncbi:HlyD family secretion protein [Parendozoicomonas haliclonae]|uniref:Multidrug export protein EmrA n=1 Tax=Parendozoicomonas haliclonae TaxID=1960125 RepID=A0A1X7AE00_9GAMM|nr:HlyD family secretion protein [Parendozoicomonas haliclonae]SMA32661.1 Multidrug export protein EmrA [Parendozoicomonas haliclonae]